MVSAGEHGHLDVADRRRRPRCADGDTTRLGGRATYSDILDRASSVDFAGVRVLVAALDDIIASKEWADRPKDREALVELRALRDDDPQP